MPKNEYLLSGYVFCGTCGKRLTGQTNPNRLSYYRDTNKECSLNPRPSVPCDALEDAVVHILVETFGNRPALERAMKKANPDHTELMEEYERLETDLAKVVKGRDRILNLVANNDTITDEDAKKQLEKLKDREQQLQQRQETIAGQLGTKVDFKQLAEQVNGLFKKG